jgi:Flp pilus assembly pilin Flp
MVRPHGASARTECPARRRGQRGAAAVEYALIAVLIAVVIIAAVTVLGGRTSGLFQKTCESLPSVGAATC